MRKMSKPSAFLRFMVRWVIPKLLVRWLLKKRWLHWSMLFTRDDVERRLWRAYGGHEPDPDSAVKAMEPDWDRMYPSLIELTEVPIQDSRGRRLRSGR